MVQTQVKKIELPSGVDQIDLRTGDHIIFFVLSESKKYIAVLRKFLLAGLNNKKIKEKTLLDIPNKSKQLKKIILHNINIKRSRQLQVFDSLYNLYTKDGVFLPKPLHNFCYKLEENLTTEGFECFRGIFPYTSGYLNEMTNPNEFLKKAEEWITNFLNIRPGVIICTYRKKDLIKGVGEYTFSNFALMAIMAHNKLLVLDEDERLHAGKEGLKHLLWVLDPFEITPKFFDLLDDEMIEFINKKRKKYVIDRLNTGEDIYNKYKNELKNKYKGKVLAIDIITQKVAGIGDTPLEAIREAKKVFGKNRYTIKWVPPASNFKVC